MWPPNPLLQRLGVDLPIIQAPMAGANDAAMAAAVSNAGGLGSLPCATLAPAQIQTQVASLRNHNCGPFNLNFFCHETPPAYPEGDAGWQDTLAPYYAELGVHAGKAPGGGRAPFSNATCEVVEMLNPPVVSFHFGLPAAHLLARVKKLGCVVLSSATTVAEALWLEQQGCDAIIAQGSEAGGHRGMFLSEDLATQAGTLALLPQIVDAVQVPVIAAGGIGDARGIVAAFALGASAVQMGTAYLLTREATISALHHDALLSADASSSVLTNVFTGRPARGLRNRLVRELGPISTRAPAFPTAANALVPLRQCAEATGSADFSPLWCGQGVHLSRPGGAADLTRSLAAQALEMLGGFKPRESVRGSGKAAAGPPSHTAPPEAPGV